MENVEECAARAGAVLRAGGVVLYPTDTLYGLGADALSDAAVAKVYALKGREEQKPMHAIVADLEMADAYGEVSDTARTLVETFGGKVTLIVKKHNVDSGIAKGIQTFGFRIPDSEFSIAMVPAFGKPFSPTSENKSGGASPRRIDAILKQLGDVAHMIDLVIDAGELPISAPSTVVDFSGSEPVILREGAISAASLHPRSH